MKEQSESEKLFYAWFFLYYLTPNQLEMTACRRLAGCSAMDAAGHALFPGMQGAPSIGQVRRQVKRTDPRLVAWGRRHPRKGDWHDDGPEEAIWKLTAAAHENRAKIAMEGAGELAYLTRKKVLANSIGQERMCRLGLAQNAW